MRNFRSQRPLRVDGEAIVDGEGSRVVLRGVGLGGWMNMENFITGYPAHGEPDAGRRAPRCSDPSARRASSIACSRASSRTATRALLADLGVNCVRIPVNYRHFERDDRPFELREEGFERLDRVVRAVRRARHLQRDRPARGARLPEPALALRQPDAHRRLLAAPALPGPRRAPVAGARRRAIATSRGSAGYNLLNEPADPSGAVVGPFHDRLVAAVREIDSDHIVFVDGNTLLDGLLDVRRALRERRLRLPRLRARRHVASAAPTRARPRASGSTATSSRRSSSSARATSARPGRRSGSASSAPSTPATPSATSSATRSSPTSSTSTTATAPGGRSGPTRTSACRGSSTPRPTAPYMERFGALIEKKARLGIDSWGSTDQEVPEVVEPVHELDRARVPGLVAVPVEPPGDGRRHRAPHPLRPGDAHRVRRALPRPLATTTSTSWPTRSPSHGA